GAATITVTSTKIISMDTTIDGGSVITVSGGNAVGIFVVTNGIMFTVQNLTIANGSASGPISDGSAIFNDRGTVTVTNSTFSGNFAREGGAIFTNSGTVTVTNSTFSGNTASDMGGAIDSANP